MLTSKGIVPTMTIQTPINNGINLFLNLAISLFYKKKQNNNEVE
jgi:hypothetical protein